MSDCPLTARQFEVVCLAMRGMTYKAIADRLGVVPNTVNSHMTLAYERVGLEKHSGRGPMFAMMLDEGWVGDDAGYAGRMYARSSQRGRHRWRPSPAEALYIEAFEAAMVDDRDVELYRAVLYDRAGVELEDRCDGMTAMFRKLGAVICTPEQRAFLQLM